MKFIDDNQDLHWEKSNLVGLIGILAENKSTRILIEITGIIDI